MTEKRWTLERRTALRFFWVATAFLLTSGVVVSAIYAVVIANELDEELIEQLDELRASYSDGAGGRIEFERLAKPLGRDGAETPIACAVTNRANGTVWGPYGPEALRALLTEADPGTVQRRSEGVRLYRGELAPDFDIAIAMDGSDWSARTRTFALVMGLVVVIGSLLSLFAGRVFGAQIARQLEIVAQEVAKYDLRTDANVAVAVPGAPDEIRSVVEALEETLRATRREFERARVLTAGLAHDS